LVARRLKEYAAVAWLLGFMVFADLVRPALTLLVLAPARAAHGLPYAGSARVPFHAEQALFVGCLAGIAALAVHAYVRRRPWPVALAYLAVVSVLVLGYPTVRRELLQGIYLATTLSVIAVSLASIALWWRGKPSAPPGPLGIASGLFLASEVGTLEL
jgi:hypothetical protein